MTKPIFMGMEPERALELIAEKRAADIKDRLVETRAELWVRVYVHEVTTCRRENRAGAFPLADAVLAEFDKRFLPPDLAKLESDRRFLPAESQGPLPADPARAEQPVQQTTMEGE